MKNTITTHFTDKQAQIDRRRKETVTRYSDVWANMTYDMKRSPDFGPVDVLFAHLWLRRGCALLEPPPLLDAFCRFCADLHPAKIILTHMEEWGRDANDFWDGSHVEQVLGQFQCQFPAIQVTPAYFGESLRL